MIFKEFKDVGVSCVMVLTLCWVASVLAMVITSALMIVYYITNSWILTIFFTTIGIWALIGSMLYPY